MCKKEMPNGLYLTVQKPPNQAMKASQCGWTAAMRQIAGFPIPVLNCNMTAKNGGGAANHNQSFLSV